MKMNHKYFYITYPKCDNLCLAQYDWEHHEFPTLLYDDIDEAIEEKNKRDKKYGGESTVLGFEIIKLDEKYDPHYVIAIETTDFEEGMYERRLISIMKDTFEEWQVDLEG